MIFYTNVSTDVPHMMFVGRWTPFHKGHRTIINKKRDESPEKPILVLVRATNYDAYPPRVRAKFIKTWMVENQVEGTIMIIPDVEGVYYGRGVGYKIEQITVPKEIEDISATKIRNAMKGEDDFAWQENVATDSLAKLSHPKTSKIIEEGHVVWLTGCPCAGKTTIALELEKLIRQTMPELRVQLLDGDIIRSTPLASKVGFSTSERKEHILRMGHLAKMFADHGILVIAAFVSPNSAVRNMVREEIGQDRFSEIYVKASKKTRMERDVKGMYEKAAQGLIENFTGYNSPYQPPKGGDTIVCDTNNMTVEDSAKLVFGQVLFD